MVYYMISRVEVCALLKPLNNGELPQHDNGSFEERRCRPINTYQHLLSVINIVEMGAGDIFFLIFPIKLILYMVAMVTILAEY